MKQSKSIKTKQEIVYLQKAARLTTQAFKQIVKKLKNNGFQTENDIKLFLKEFTKKNNTKFSFPPIIASNKNTRKIHHKTSKQKLQKGFLLIDFGIRYKGYCSDMTRMLFLGKPNKKQINLYNFLLKIQKQAIKNIKPNKKASEIDTEVRKKLGRYASYFLHSIGHGVGTKIHERPSFRLDSQDTIQKNQVFAIEPGLYFKNFGLRIEDTLLMKNKPKILTKTSKKLISINI